MKRNQFFSKLGVVVLLTLLVLIGCAEANDETPENGEITAYQEVAPVEEQRTLTVALEGDAVSLDPQASNVGNSINMFTQIYEPLVRLGANSDVVGVLAESWERVDDYSYVFHLKQGVYFHNGQRMTANDVAFSIIRGTEMPAVAAVMDVFDPARTYAIDDYTVQIGTLFPFVSLLNNLTHPATSILSQYAYEAGYDFDLNPIGTGPFKKVSRLHGDRLELAAFEDFHGTRPAFDYLILRSITDLNARQIALETGEVDIANLTRTNISAVEAAEHLTLHMRETLMMLYVGMNVQRIPDIRVRQAISYAINVPEIHETLLYGVGEILHGPVNPLLFGAHPDLYAFDYNPERARELLAEAGYAEGLNLNILVNEFGERLEWATAVQAYLARVGITLEIIQVETPVFLETTANGQYDMFVLTWTAGTGDTDRALHPLFHSVNQGGPGNRTFFSHPDVDRLLDTARYTFDDEARLALYLEAQEIIVDEAAKVYLATGSVIVGARNNIRGLNLSPIGIQMFYTVYFD